MEGGAEEEIRRSSTAQKSLVRMLRFMNSADERRSSQRHRQVQRVQTPVEPQATYSTTCTPLHCTPSSLPPARLTAICARADGSEPNAPSHVRGIQCGACALHDALLAEVGDGVAAAA